MKFSITDLLVVITTVSIGVMMNVTPHHVTVAGNAPSFTTYGEPYFFVSFGQGLGDEVGNERTIFFPLNLAMDVATWLGVVVFVLFIKRVVIDRFLSSPKTSQ